MALRYSDFTMEAIRAARVGTLPHLTEPKPKHFSKMTSEQMEQMQNAVQEAAIQFAQDNGFSGLSHAGWFDFHAALQDAIEGEWRKATEKKSNGA